MHSLTHLVSLSACAPLMESDEAQRHDVQQRGHRPQPPPPDHPPPSPPRAGEAEQDPLLGPAPEPGAAGGSGDDDAISVQSRGEGQQPDGSFL